MNNNGREDGNQEDEENEKSWKESRPLERQVGGMEKGDSNEPSFLTHSLENKVVYGVVVTERQTAQGVKSAGKSGFPLFVFSFNRALKGRLQVDVLSLGRSNFSKQLVNEKYEGMTLIVVGIDALIDPLPASFWVSFFASAPRRRPV